MDKLNTKFDLLLTLPIGLLIATSFTVLSSIAPDLIRIQLTALVIGIIAYILMTTINYHIWVEFKIYIYLIFVLFLITPYAFGYVSGGSLRWLQLYYFSIQPSEIARPFLVIVLASLIVGHQTLTWKQILWSGSLVMIPALIIFGQPNLGMALTLIVSWIGMILTKGPTRAQVIIGLLLLGTIIPLGWRYLLQDYQKTRIMSFINPDSDPLNSGYNVLQSQIAIGSGQIFGRGLGRGSQSHLKFLPERHTDFIFASLAEELGLIGASWVLLLYTWLFLRVIVILSLIKDHFSILLITGLLSGLVFQTFVNIGMNMGLLPVTGVTLPMISYGGSSLVTTLISLGLINRFLIQQRTSQSLHIH